MMKFWRHVRYYEFLLTYLAKFKNEFVFVFVVFLLQIILLSFIPLLSKYVIDVAVRGGPLWYIMVMIVGGGIVYLLIELFRYISSVRMSKIGIEVILDMKIRLLDHMLRLPIYVFDSRNSGYVLQRLSEVDILGKVFSISSYRFIVSFFKVIVALIALFWIRYEFALIVIALSPIIAWFSWRIVVGYHQISRKLVEERASVKGLLQQMIYGISEVKVLGGGDIYGKVINNLKQVYLKSFHRDRLLALGTMRMNLLSSLEALLVLGLGAYFIRDGKMSMGDYMAVSIYSSYVFSSISFMASYIVQMQPVVVTLDRLSEFLRMDSEDRLWGSYKKDRVNGNIVFQNVSFSYTNESRVLCNVSFRILAKRLNLIVGRNGIGKTTVLKLLLGFYHTYEGKILLDGVSLKSYDVRWLRSRIGIVSQRITLFEGTVLDNICMGIDNCNEELLEEIITMLNIRKYIGDPRKVLISEMGKNLSGGQKKLIALARAMLRNVDIIIFDEAEASLDEKMTKVIRDIVCDLDLTRIVVTHDYELYSCCNLHIVDLNQINRCE